MLEEGSEERALAPQSPVGTSFHSTASVLSVLRLSHAKLCMAHGGIKRNRTQWFLLWRCIQ